MNTPTPEDTISEEPKSRRDALKAALKVLGMAGAGLVGGRLLSGSKAEASDGDPLIIGSSSNAGAARTMLTSSGGVGEVGLEVEALSADAALVGVSEQTGAYGFSTLFGVLGIGGVGGTFAANDETTDSALWLSPRSTPGTPGGFHTVGEMVVDSSGVLYLCVAEGTPGTWIRVSHGGVRLLNAPQRAYNTQTAGGRFAAGQTRNVNIAGAVPGVPSNALGIVATLQVFETVSTGYLTVWPAGVPRTQTSNITWFGPNQKLSGLIVVRIGSGGNISIYAKDRTHVIVDVSAYIL